MINLPSTLLLGVECHLVNINILIGARSDRHLPPYPPRDILHHMGHVPEFLGPFPTGIAAAHFHPPMMPVPPPHMIPGSGFAAVPHPQFATPFHPVPIIPFHEPWVNNHITIYSNNLVIAAATTWPMSYATFQRTL